MATFSERQLHSLTHGEPQIVAESDIVAMEDAIVTDILPPAETIRPDVRTELLANWRRRERLLDVVRGKSFYGRLIDPVDAGTRRSARESGGYSGQQTSKSSRTSHRQIRNK